MVNTERVAGDLHNVYLGMTIFLPAGIRQCRQSLWRNWRNRM